MIGWNPPNITIITINVPEAVYKQWPAQFKTSHSASLIQHTCDYALTKFKCGFSQGNLSKFKHVLFMIYTIPVQLALMNMHNGKWQIMYQGWYIWKVTKCKMENYVSNWHIQKEDANGMICQYTHIIKISHA